MTSCMLPRRWGILIVWKGKNAIRGAISAKKLVRGAEMKD